MKKIILMLLCLALIPFSAIAEVRLGMSPLEEAAFIAKGEFSAENAFFSPYDDSIYYLQNGNVIKFDAEINDYITLYTLPEGSRYVSISADSDGSIYVLKDNEDVSKKSSLILLANENDRYIPIEYTFSLAANDLNALNMDYSSYSSTGFVLFSINGETAPVQALSVFSLAWGSIEGYDEVIAFKPGALSAEVYSLSAFADTYGYINESGIEFAKSIESGALLSPTQASLSPSGNTLLLLTPFEGSTVLYAMDVYSLALQMVYPPDDFSGSASWTQDDQILLSYDNGKTETLALQPFESESWGNSWTSDWKSADDGWSDFENGWNQTDESTLDDWS
ncbi:MAG: hypothetical protein IJC48_07020 [Clostridia bacterium]|nr:hypothetical protein [Clostridia bacterium]